MGLSPYQFPGSPIAEKRSLLDSCAQQVMTSNRNMNQIKFVKNTNYSQIYKYLHIYDIPFDFDNCCSCINPIIYGVYYFSERNSTIIGHRSNPAHRWEPQWLTKDFNCHTEASCTLHPFKQAEVATVKQEHLQFCTGDCSNLM